jgi:hypothetical protein
MASMDARSSSGMTCGKRARQFRQSLHQFSAVASGKLATFARQLCVMDLGTIPGDSGSNGSEPSPVTCAACDCGVRGSVERWSGYSGTESGECQLYDLPSSADHGARATG